MTHRETARPDPRLAYVDHRVEDVARRIHAVQMLAYREEAKLLRAARFPPLERTVADIQSSREEFCCTYLAGELVGALGTCPDEKGQGVNIASLVVHPDFRRPRAPGAAGRPWPQPTGGQEIRSRASP